MQNDTDFNPVTPDGYAKVMSDETSQLEFQHSKTIDIHFNNRVNEIKNALVHRGWTLGDQPTNMTKKTDSEIVAGLVFRFSKVTPNDIVGVAIEVATVKSGVIYQRRDDLSKTATKLADEISSAVTNQEILQSLIDDFGWTNQGGSGALQWVTKDIGGGFKGALNPDGIRRICALVGSHRTRATYGDDTLVSAPIYPDLTAKQNAKALDDLVNEADPEYASGLAEHYQWQRNKQDGQTFGNQKSILPLTNNLFNKYVAPIVKIKDFHVHQEEYPHITHLELTKKADGEIMLGGIGPIYELRPAQDSINKGWVIKVDSFDSEIAIAHGNSANQEDDEDMCSGGAPQL